MRIYAAVAMLAVGLSLLAAQSPTMAPSIDDAEIGFRYSLPADWEAVASKPPSSNVPYPALVGPKKGNTCTQVVLTARRGDPVSVVVVVALPFDCYGQTLTDANFDEFASGAAEGLKQTFNVTEPVIARYSLGSQSMWAERAKGEVRGQPGPHYPLEVVCALLAKGAACWMLMATDDSIQKAFEQGSVTFEGQEFPSLVPPDAFSAATPTEAGAAH